MSLPVIAFAVLSWSVVVVPWLGNVIEVIPIFKSFWGSESGRLVNTRIVLPRIASTVSRSELVDVIGVSKNIQVLFPSFDRLKFIVQDGEGMKEGKFIFPYQKNISLECPSFMGVVGNVGKWAIMGNGVIFNHDLSNSRWGLAKIFNFDPNVVLGIVGINLFQSWWEMGHFDIGSINDSLIVSERTVKPRLSTQNYGLQKGNNNKPKGVLRYQVRRKEVFVILSIPLICVLYFFGYRQFDLGRDGLGWLLIGSVFCCFASATFLYFFNGFT